MAPADKSEGLRADHYSGKTALRRADHGIHARELHHPDGRHENRT